MASKQKGLKIGLGKAGNKVRVRFFCWQHCLRWLNIGNTSSYPYTRSNAQESHFSCRYSKEAWRFAGSNNNKASQTIRIPSRFKVVENAKCEGGGGGCWGGARGGRDWGGGGGLGNGGGWGVGGWGQGGWEWGAGEVWGMGWGYRGGLGVGAVGLGTVGFGGEGQKFLESALFSG